MMRAFDKKYKAMQDSMALISNAISVYKPFFKKEFAAPSDKYSQSCPALEPVKMSGQQ